MSPPSDYESHLRQSLERSRSAPSVADVVLAEIRGRSPVEMAAVHQTRTLRGLSGLAALVLASLVVTTWSLTPGARGSLDDELSQVNADEPVIVAFEEEWLAETADESAILSAVFLVENP